MRKTKSGNMKLNPEVEPDFTHSRLGLSTHKRNTAEQQRLEDKLRSLDSMQRRSVRQYNSQQREVLQCLSASHPAQPPGTPSRLGDGNALFQEGLTSSRLSRRRSLQPDSVGFVAAKDYGSESVTALNLSPPRRSRRSSVSVQDLLNHPVIDVSSVESGTSPDNDTIIDIIAARNRPGRPRRASLRGAAGEVEDLADKAQEGQLKGETPDKGSRRTRRESVTGAGPGLLDDSVNPLKTELCKGDNMDTRPRRPSRASLAGEGAAADGDRPACRFREGHPQEERTDRGLALPVRGRRASLDVGISNLSLLSPTSPGSRLGASRRSSLASSQGTPSTPSTPDSRPRDIITFAFPSPTSNATSQGRHVLDIKPRLHRSHSSDNFIMSPSSSRQAHVTGTMTSQGSHKRNSSLKLPTMQRRRKSVIPSVSTMILMHGVLQNSSSFKAQDFDEQPSE